MATKQKQSDRRGRRVLVDDLYVGAHIVTRWRPAKGSKEALSDDEVMRTLRGDGDDGGRVVDKAFKVEQLALCEGQWRTHRHVNKSMCYDSRQYVWIVAE